MNVDIWLNKFDKAKAVDQLSLMIIFIISLIEKPPVLSFYFVFESFLTLTERARLFCLYDVYFFKIFHNIARRAFRPAGLL